MNNFRPSTTTKFSGGWTLVLNNINSTNYTFTSKNQNPLIVTTAGSHYFIKEIFDVSKEFRWTDSSNIRFLQGKTNMPIWWTKISSQTCNTTGNTIDVKFENGWFNTSINTRKVESCIWYPFGMRNNTSYAPFNDVSGYNNTTTHMCWYDQNAFDRPFSQSHDTFSPTVSYCTQFNFPFNSTASRGGTMNYRVWVR